METLTTMVTLSQQLSPTFYAVLTFFHFRYICLEFLSQGVATKCAIYTGLCVGVITKSLN